MWGKLHSATAWPASRIWLVASFSALALPGSDALSQTIAGSQDVAVSEAAAAAASEKPEDGLARQLDAARAELRALKGELAATRNAGNNERAKREMMEQNFALLRNEIDALKNDMKGSADAREETLRRELAQAREELAALRKDKTVSRPQLDAELITRQNQVLDEERQRADRLADELTAAEREIERLKSEGAAVVGLGDETTRALDQERRKVWLLSHELVELRRAKEEQDTDAMIAEAVRSVAEPDRQQAEAATGDPAQLPWERQRAESAEQELTALRRELDAAKEDLARVAAANDMLTKEGAGLAKNLATAEQERDTARNEAAQVAALEDTLRTEREKTADLVRRLATAREEIDALKAEGKRRTSSVEEVLKRGDAREKRETTDRAASKPKIKVAASTRDRKPKRSVGPLRIKLPAALLPTELAGDDLQ